MGYESQSYPLESSSKPCRPDYETLIKRAKEELTTTKEIITALLKIDSIGLHVPVEQSIMTVIGRLHLHEAQLSLNIERAIQEYESDKS